MILAVLQARMGSTRLPGKSMATLRGEPMIIRQLERLRGARCLSKIIVATSQDEADDALAGFLVSRGHTVHRGAGADILARLVAEKLGAALGVEAMSLYHHVPSKDALLDGVHERILASLEPPPQARTWQTFVRHQALALHRALQDRKSVV